MNDRTRVVSTDLGVALAFVWLYLRLRFSFPDEERDAIDSRSLSVGALAGFSVGYAIERDPIASKLERYRYRVVLSLVENTFSRVLFRLSPSREGVAIGYLVGVVCYRFVFGVVRDVPEGRLRRASLLDRWRRSERESA